MRAKMGENGRRMDGGGRENGGKCKNLEDNKGEDGGGREEKGIICGAAVAVLELPAIPRLWGFAP